MGFRSPFSFFATVALCFALIVTEHKSPQAFSMLGGQQQSTRNVGIMSMAASNNEEIAHAQGRRAMLQSILTGSVAASFVLGDNALADEGEGEGSTFHKLDYPVAGKCGQANNVPDKAAFFIRQFGGFSDGACAVDGYSSAEGTANGTGEKDSQRVYAIYGQ
uniref:Uncharacterized protein n=1 Tax=Entomoneis paludosa TaxID=265537 RepID=A0A7S3DNV8_9STRA|mmetsp:Transcript_24522/g.51020  ORF Transcript_24522/g.51020 Transcript_24522/m.51020 type:complete len:162 (+) Transcript_24522:88-573(+)